VRYHLVLQLRCCSRLWSSWRYQSLSWRWRSLWLLQEMILLQQVPMNRKVRVYGSVFFFIFPLWLFSRGFILGHLLDMWNYGDLAHSILDYMQCVTQLCHVLCVYPRIFYNCICHVIVFSYICWAMCNATLKFPWIIHHISFLIGWFLTRILEV
jgi:hypothetical protein